MAGGRRHFVFHYRQPNVLGWPRCACGSERQSVSDALTHQLSSTQNPGLFLASHFVLWYVCSGTEYVQYMSAEAEICTLKMFMAFGKVYRRGSQEIIKNVRTALMDQVKVYLVQGGDRS